MSVGSVPKLFPLSRRFSAGDLIGGKYRLTEQIGAGAMGAVWTAHNELLDILVAVKLLRIDNQRADPDRLYKRLLQEARAAARLGHPGIVRVFDFGQADDGSPFIAMERLEGESLADLMCRKRRTDPVEAAQLILPLVDALAMAHGRGIVHRDIKPENIFLSRDEYGRLQPKIVDFGVARFAEGGRSMTKSGALLGTPDYMAPEQARGEPDIDHRVDVWALCTVLYELITGHRPFARDSANYLAVLRAIVHEQAPPLSDFGITDPALWVIIERGLRKRRNERWDTMRVLGEALALWLYELGVREDALGASLKTTWLQSGLDGIKIETSSMAPPRLDEDDEGAEDDFDDEAPTKTVSAVRPQAPSSDALVEAPREHARTGSIPIIEDLSQMRSPVAPAVATKSTRPPATSLPLLGAVWISAALLFCSFVGGAAFWGRSFSPEKASAAPDTAVGIVAAETLPSTQAPPARPSPPIAETTVAAPAPAEKLVAIDAEGRVEGAPEPSGASVAGPVTSSGGDLTQEEAPAPPPATSVTATHAARPHPPKLAARKPARSTLPSARSYDFGF